MRTSGAIAAITAVTDSYAELSTAFICRVVIEKRPERPRIRAQKLTYAKRENHGPRLITLLLHGDTVGGQLELVVQIGARVLVTPTTTCVNMSNQTDGFTERTWQSIDR